MKILKLAFVLLCLCLTAPSWAQNGTRGQLTAGAAKVDFTPAESELPEGSYGILNHVYSRAIVVGNGSTRCALISIDAGGVHEGLYQEAKKKIMALGIPEANIIITATHTHAGARVDNGKLSDKIAESVRLAIEKMQPAQVCYGEGVSYLNVRRDLFDAERGSWWEGPNYGAESDKTVGVIYFKTLNDKPIGVYYNYAMHAVITGNLDMVSADVPGETSTYIEESVGDDIVALWSEGAAGDQNPIFFQQTFDLRDIRIADYAKKGIDISNKMPPGGQGMDRSNPKVRQLMDEQKRMMMSFAQILGEEVKHTMREMRRFETNVTLNGAQKTITVPGRKLVNNEGRAGYAGVYEDADPVELRLGLIMIDDIPIGTINAEIYNKIGVRFKKASPYRRTMIATITNGFAAAGYIPDDESYGAQSFEVITSRVKQGYAETAIVNGLLDLIHDVTH